MRLLLTRLLLLCTTLVAVAAQQDGLATIYEHSLYSQLRPCGQGCFIISVASTRDLLGSRLGCPISTLLSTKLALNNCYCRADLQSNAHVILSSCVHSRCQLNTNDVTSAQAIYSDYCAGNGYAAGGGQTAPKPTGSSGGIVGGSGPAPGATVGGGSLPTGVSYSSVGRVPRGNLMGLMGLMGVVCSVLFFI
ncbi:hypothetical protein QBC43DRAFT_294541 [Cladorrhinum sp. PSN259]|nr:hypothetical protein QBC43DRAFT_294541 [Cladorrhinum sp. PSN259]